MVMATLAMACATITVSLIFVNIILVIKLVNDGKKKQKNVSKEKT